MRKGNRGVRLKERSTTVTGKQVSTRMSAWGNFHRRRRSGGFDSGEPRSKLLADDLDSAYAAAQALRESAAASGDLVAVLRTEKHLKSLLELRLKKLQRLPVSETPINPTQKPGGFRHRIEMPPGLEMFSTPFQTEPEDPSWPVIVFRVKFQPETKSKLLADEEAKAQEIEAALRLVLWSWRKKQDAN